jgi:hypothetical protein
MEFPFPYANDTHGQQPYFHDVHDLQNAGVEAGSEAFPSYCHDGPNNGHQGTSLIPSEHIYQTCASFLSFF